MTRDSCPWREWRPTLIRLKMIKQTAIENIRSSIRLLYQIEEIAKRRDGEIIYTTELLHAATALISALYDALEPRSEADYYSNKATADLLSHVEQVRHAAESAMPSDIGVAAQVLGQLADNWRTIVAGNPNAQDKFNLDLEEVRLQSKYREEQLEHELQRAVNTRNAVLEELNRTKSKLEETYEFLKDPLRTKNYRGAAGIFSNNATRAARAQLSWGVLFIGIILSIFWFGYRLTFSNARTFEPLIFSASMEAASRNGSTATDNERDRASGVDPTKRQSASINIDRGPLNAFDIQYANLLLRLATLSPLIWLAWFAARQYGFMSKVSEDYSFKSAVTMAVEAITATEADASKNGAAMDVTLRTLAENPLRIYKIRNEPSTPLQELLDSMREFSSKSKSAMPGKNWN